MNIEARFRQLERRKLVAWAAYALGALACLAPQLLGGVTRSTHATILAISAVATGYAAWVLISSKARLGSTPQVVAGLCLLTLWTGLQLVTVPCSWVDPQHGFTVETLRTLTGESSMRCAISSAPGSTIVALATLASQCSLVVTSLGLARTGHGKALIYAIGAGSALMACVALIHTVVGAERVFGLYTPRSARPGLLLAPLLNGNHLAGQLALGFPVCLHVAVTARRIDVRLGAITASLIVFAAGALTLSKGGLVALTGGLLAYVVASKRSSSRQYVTLGRTVIVATLAGLFVTYLSADLLLIEFGNTDSGLNKLTMIRTLSTMAGENWALGVGRGAFGFLSPGYLDAPGYVARYAENVIVHWSAEWGIPATLLLVASLAHAVTMARWPSLRSQALGIGLAALFTQNLVDFSLELPGIGAAAAISLGTFLGSGRSRTRRTSALGGRLPQLRLAIPSIWAASIPLGALSLHWLGPASVPEREQQLMSLLEAPHDQFERALQGALDDYPLAPGLLLLGAARAVRDDRGDSLEWLNLTMRMAPGWGPPHEQAASYLERHGRLSQAALEMGLSIPRDVNGFTRACGFLQRHPSKDLAWDIAGDDAGLAEQLAQCLLAHEHELVAATLLTDIVERYPARPTAYAQLVHAKIRSGQSREALEFALTMRDRLPMSPESLGSLMKAYLANARPEDALAVYESAPPLLRRQRTVLMNAAGVAVQMKDPLLLDALISEVFSLGSEDVAGLHNFAASQYDAAGLVPKAVMHLESAYNLTGDPETLERAYDAAQRALLPQAALRAAARLCHIQHRGLTYCSRLGPR